MGWLRQGALALCLWVPAVAAATTIEDAIEARLAADATGDLEDYAAAIALLRVALAEAPAEERPRLLMYLADTLSIWGSAQGDDRALREAGELCVLLLKNGPGEPSANFATLARVRVAQHRVQLTPAGFDTVPRGAEILGHVPRRDGSPDPETGDVLGVPVYALAPELEEFLAAAQALFSWNVVDSGSRDQLLAPADELQLRFLCIELLLSHHHFDEAVPRLLELVQRHPISVEAGIAARLLVETYVLLGDLEQVRVWTGVVDRRTPGAAGPRGGERVGSHADLVSVEFKRCLQHAYAADPLAAADCFIGFTHSFPESAHVNVALYNAANSYELAGQAERAAELYEHYVNTYPDDERSARLYFRVAGQYESMLQLERAISYYERLVRQFPEHVDASAAHYNAAFLQLGLNDYAGAATSLEDYASRFPQQRDVEEVFFLAFPVWELVGPREHRSFCQRYLQRTDFDSAPERESHRLVCLGTLADLTAAEGDSRSETRWLDEAERAYVLAQQKGRTELDPAALSVVARSRLRVVDGLHADILSLGLLNDRVRELYLFEGMAFPAIDQLQQQLPGIAELHHPVAMLHAQVALSTAQLHIVDLGRASLCAAEPERCDDPAALSELTALEARAVEQLAQTLERAALHQMHPEALDRAQAALHERDPERFHLPWAELPAKPQADELQFWVHWAHFEMSRPVVE